MFYLLVTMTKVLTNKCKEVNLDQWLPQVFCVVDVEIPQLVEEAARLAEEEEGGLDVEHRVEVLKQQLLLVLDITCGKFLDRLVVIMVSTRL